jgi:hypothetical protein
LSLGLLHRTAMGCSQEARYRKNKQKICGQKGRAFTGYPP